MTWTRHHLDRRWHLVVESGASIVSACRGRFAAYEPHEHADRPPEADRCARCQEEYVDQRLTTMLDLRPSESVGEMVEAEIDPVERGLSELVAATPMVRFQFDMSDLEDVQ